MESTQVTECTIDSYHVTLSLHKALLGFEAYSELTGKQFEAELADNKLSLPLKHAYGDCTAIYLLCKEAVLE